ncbi:MAG TPA: hypothetical protein VFZ81_01310 [Burkholderiales bacterium]
MHNRLVTPFWKSLLESLPPEVRARHVHDIEAAERWELGVGALIEAWTHVKNALGRMFHTPRSAH